MTARVLVLNGPNLAQLGSREPAIYGHAGYDELVSACLAAGEQLQLDVDVRQTDDESMFLTWLHDARDGVDGLVLNPAAWTHTSVAIRDAAAMLQAPYIEVHLSNPLAREEFRHVSFTASGALGVIAGFGVDSYLLALRALAAHLQKR